MPCMVGCISAYRAWPNGFGGVCCNHRFVGFRHGCGSFSGAICINPADFIDVRQAVILIFTFTEYRKSYPRQRQSTLTRSHPYPSMPCCILSRCFHLSRRESSDSDEGRAQDSGRRRGNQESGRAAVGDRPLPVS